LKENQKKHLHRGGTYVPRTRGNELVVEAYPRRTDMRTATFWDPPESPPAEIEWQDFRKVRELQPVSPKAERTHARRGKEPIQGKKQFFWRLRAGKIARGKSRAKKLLPGGQPRNTTGRSSTK